MLYWMAHLGVWNTCSLQVQKLRDNEKKVWLRLLIGSQNVSQFESYRKWGCSIYDKLKGMSAYADKTIIVNDYGYGFSTIRGEFQAMIDSWIKNEGMCVNQADKYALVFDELPRPKVEWLGHFSKKSPFEHDRKRD